MSLARQITEERLRELLDENKTEIVEAVAALLADAAPKRRRRPVVRVPEVPVKATRRQQIKACQDFGLRLIKRR